MRAKVTWNFFAICKSPLFSVDSKCVDEVRRLVFTLNQAASVTDLQLLAPRGRERRISTFFLKSLESLISEWELLVTAEIVSSDVRPRRRSYVTFETLLMFNGTCQIASFYIRPQKLFLW
jgi:serine-protein kinase ATM